jgi:hypothetical protein
LPGIEESKIYAAKTAVIDAHCIKLESKIKMPDEFYICIYFLKGCHQTNKWLKVKGF